MSTRAFPMSIFAALGILAIGLAAAAAPGQETPIEVPAEQAVRDATWRVTTAWNNGANGPFDITFRSDGSLIAAAGIRGRWFQVGSKYIWAFNAVGSSIPDWSITYAGEIGANGTTLDGVQGWEHTSGRPKGVHTGVRAFEFVEDASRLTTSGQNALTGEGESK